MYLCLFLLLSTAHAAGWVAPTFSRAHDALAEIVDSTTEFVDMPSTSLRNAVGDAVHSSVKKDQDDAMPSSVEALSVGYFFAISF